MKKFVVAGFIGVIAFASCENTGSSTVGTYEREETHSSEKKESGTGHGNAKEAAGHATEDSAKAGHPAE